MSILANISAAVEIIMGRESGLQRMDTSADGFYASFKGLALVGVIDGVTLVTTHPMRLQLDAATYASPIPFALATLFIALCAYGASLVALYLLCRTPELQRRFSLAVIAHNWASPVVSVIFTVPFIILLVMQVKTAPEQPGFLASIILMGSLAALVLVGVRLMRISLGVSNGIAVTFFAATAAVSLIMEMWISRAFGL